MAAKFFTAALIAAAGVVANPIVARDVVGKPFSLTALRSGDQGVHFQSFQAEKGGIALGLEKLDIQCEGDVETNFATFVLSDKGELKLHGDANQRLFTDMSGMGQGILGYRPGDESVPDRWSVTGWSFDASNNLSLDGTSFLACPNGDNTYRVFMATGNPTPIGIQGCVGVVARANFLDADATKCTY